MRQFSLTREDFTTPIEQDGTTFYTLGDIVSGEILNLDPGNPTTLSLTVQGRAGSAAPSITIQQDSKQTSSATGQVLTVTHAVTLDPEWPPTFTINGWQQDAAVTGIITVTESPAGPQRLKVLAWLPNPRYTSAILGSAILGSFVLPSENSALSGFTLGLSRLGAARLPLALGYHTWQHLTPDSTAVTIERGLTHNGITGQGDIGTLTMRLYEPRSPRAIGLKRGTLIKAIDARTRSRLFTGALSKAPSPTRSPSGSTSYALEATDTLSTLAAIKRYQVTPARGHWWTYSDVMDELLTKHGITWRTLEPAEPGIELGPTMNEYSLTQYLDMYLATVGATWWVDAYSRVTATRRLPEIPEAMISDRRIETEIPLLAHVAEAVTWDTASVISTLEIKNNGIEQDESGEIRTSQTELTFKNEDLATLYGETTASFETAALTPSSLTALAKDLLTAYEPQPIISSARFTPWKDTHRDEAALDVLTGLDLMAAVSTHALGETAVTNIVKISHSVTPLAWYTTLNLTERKPL